MQTTTISNFRTFISAYLRQIKDGEELLITEYGRPVARVLPANSDASAPEYLLEIEKRGQLRRALTSLPDNFWDLPRPMDPGARVRLAVAQEQQAGR